jgi:YceI-like domain
MVVFAMLLAACGVPKPRPASPQLPTESSATPNLQSAGRLYRVDPGQSQLRILVYRAGPLARLGHNHVIINRSVQGIANLADSNGVSTFRLTIPVSDFVVDDGQARSEEGPDFEGQVSDEAKSGTLHNMLGASLLDADKFPQITVDCTAAPAAQDRSGNVAMSATLVVRIAGHQSKIDLPVTLKSDARRLTSSGSLELRQSALGLVPYSLMLGALQVQDAVTIKFDIVAVGVQ